MKFLIAISTLLVASVVAQHKTSYNGYKLVDISLQDLDQVKFLNSLEDVDPEFDIWNIANKTNEIVATVMLSPRTQLEYMNLFRAKGNKVHVVSNNVQDMIDYQEKTMELTYYKNSGRSIIQKYARYSEIINFVLEVVDENKDIASTYVIGQTDGKRDLRVIVFKTATSKRALWIDCGIHAREWVTPATCVYVINEIVREYRANNPETVALLNKYEIHILPVYNPDGYEFSHTTTRLWRKNRSTNAGSTCIGTDLNRNCDFRWNTGGASSNPCSETFAGAKGNSELETQAVTAALKALEGQWDAYISVHSYGDWWLLPWGHSASDIPPTFNQLKANGDIGAAAIKAQFGETFTVGSSSALLYVTTGSSADWAFGVINVPYSYTLELRPGSGTPDYVYGFTLPEDRLPRVTVETWAGIKASLNDISAKLP